MKLYLTILLVASVPVSAQTVPLQSAVAAAAAQQSAQFPLTAPSSDYRCTPIPVRVAIPSYEYIEPKKGYAPSWFTGQFYRALPFQATPVWQGQTFSDGTHTNTIKEDTWPNADTKVQRIAETSTSTSATSTVRSWSENGKTHTESEQQSEVTINGKTYRYYEHHFSTTPGTESTTELYYCR